MRSRLAKADSNWCSRLAAMSAIAPWVANIAPIAVRFVIKLPASEAEEVQRPTVGLMRAVLIVGSIPAPPPSGEELHLVRR
jgi:hypothetical protein